ncbi:hypothetical protein NIM87_00870 [Devosia sp. XJ19-1]|uniref:Uncharacterized protein n=1 Tax=Devosia ureilytica TaxID=2952754 RepID=A0A9Q4ALJ4_9HYPH|nr:hypothetical protein [Devosia ureilytica]MCP8882050.1 hypothetical protein [Devosia ureilytica]MCP8886064.1 hypothetical protein [Devosia ureilytica]
MALASPVQASGGLFCEGEGGEIDIAMGRLVVMQVLGAFAEIDGERYSTGPERGEGTPFAVGQAFAEGDEMMVDFVDPNFEDIIVSLRVSWDAAAESYSGVLSTPTRRVEVRCMEG